MVCRHARNPGAGESAGGDYARVMGGKHLVLASLLLIAACSDGSSHDRTEQPNGSVVPASDAAQAGTALAAELATLRSNGGGRLPKADAIDLFASTFGAMPGGDPTRFTGMSEGTSALFELMHYWSELSPDQQQSVNEALGIVGDDPGSGPPRVRPYATLQSEVDAAAAAIAARVGFDLPFPIRADEVDLIGAPRTDALVLDGITYPMQGGEVALTGAPDACKVRVRIDRAPGTVTHEVFHCFQYALAGDMEHLWDSWVWVMEGGASWVAAELTGDVDVGPFTSWMAHHGSVGDLSYEAIAVFWVVEAMGVDPFTVVDDMLIDDSTLTETIAATGVDPAAVMSRLASSAARGAGSPALPVSEIWEFGVDHVPPDSDRHTAEVTSRTPFRLATTKPEWSREPAQVLSIPTGDRVDVRTGGSVGSFEFFGQDAIGWTGQFHEQFCLLTGGCRCGVDGSVDSGLRQGAREMVLAGGAIGAGRLSFEVRLGDEGFTDGHWTGRVLTNSTVLSGDGTTGTREDTGTFELTVENGAVVAGSYTLGGPVELLLGGASAAGTGELAGTITGCGFAPQVLCSTWTTDVTMQFPGGAGSMPLHQSTPCGSTGPSTTAWVFDPRTGPNVITGQIDPTPQLNLARAAGLDASSTVITFEATRDG